jgi:hypothetical protein
MTHIYLSNVLLLLVVSHLQKSFVIVTSNVSSFLIIVNHNRLQNHRSILSTRMFNECLYIHERCPTLITSHSSISMRQNSIHVICLMISHVCDEVLRVTEVLATHVTRTLERVIEAFVAEKFPDWETHTIC